MFNAELHQMRTLVSAIPSRHLYRARPGRAARTPLTRLHTTAGDLCRSDCHSEVSEWCGCDPYRILRHLEHA